MNILERLNENLVVHDNIERLNENLVVHDNILERLNGGKQPGGT